MLFAHDVVIKLDENIEEYVKLRMTSDSNDVIIVEVNGQKSVVNIKDLEQAVEKIKSYNVM